ncbi:MAG TPA: GspMb/PilO family protein [Bryobacteraceae bacterium]|nr:GspMb/PilO family protein [Bryobacteraceae bacterium]
MPRSFNLNFAFNFREPKFLVRAGLGLLLVANLAAAVFAFHLVGASPESINDQLNAARLRLLAAQTKLSRSKMLAGRVDKGRDEGTAFLNSYVSSRRHTYSTVIGEITELAKTAGMNMKEATIAPLDAIEGSEDLDMMTISVNFEGGYPQLIRLVNLLDRSPRFLIIESLQAAPQPKGDILTVNLKLNTFVREEPTAAPARSGM